MKTCHEHPRPTSRPSQAIEQSSAPGAQEELTSVEAYQSEPHSFCKKPHRDEEQKYCSPIQLQHQNTTLGAIVGIQILIDIPFIC